MKREDYSVELCPKCYGITKLTLNSFPQYECKNCGEEYSIEKTISAIDETKISDDSNFLEKLLGSPNTIKKIRMNKNQKNLFSK